MQEAGFLLHVVTPLVYTLRRSPRYRTPPKLLGDVTVCTYFESEQGLVEIAMVRKLESGGGWCFTGGYKCF